MAFNITGLEEYVALNTKDIATKAVSTATTAKLLIDNKSVQVGIKGSAPLLKMDADVNLQSAANCSRVALGNTILSNKRISVSPIMDVQNICPHTLDNSFFVYGVAAGQASDAGFTNEFGQQIMDYRALKIAEAVEVALWAGDTASGNANLAHFDGLLKLTAGSTITATGGDIIAKLQSVYSLSPIAVRTKEDFRLFVGEDVFDEYTIALANKNIFKPVEDFKLFGTNVKLEKTAGLNGLRKVYASRIGNMVLGMDGVGESEKATLRYSVETKQWYMDFEFAVGIQVVETAEAFIATV